MITRMALFVDKTLHLAEHLTPQYFDWEIAILREELRTKTMINESDWTPWDIEILACCPGESVSQ